MDNLSRDILEEIFLWTCNASRKPDRALKNTQGFTRQAVRLAGVCGSWRVWVFAKSDLWRYIDTGRLELMKKAISRANHRRLQVVLRQSGHSLLPRNVGKLELFKDQILPRVQYIHLDDSLGFSQPYLKTLWTRQTPCLTELELHDVDFFERVAPTGFQSLERLSIEGTRCPWDLIPLLKLRELSIVGSQPHLTHEDLMRKIQSLGPCLESLTLRNIYYIKHSDDPILAQPRQKFEKLRKLVLDNLHATFVTAFFHRSFLPSIKIMNVTTSDHDSESGAVLAERLKPACDGAVWMCSDLGIFLTETEMVFYTSTEDQRDMQALARYSQDADEVERLRPDFRFGVTLQNPMGRETIHRILHALPLSPAKFVTLRGILKNAETKNCLEVVRNLSMNTTLVSLTLDPDVWGLFGEYIKEDYKGVSGMLCEKGSVQDRNQKKEVLDGSVVGFFGLKSLCYQGDCKMDRGLTMEECEGLYAWLKGRCVLGVKMEALNFNLVNMPSGINEMYDDVVGRFSCEDCIADDTVVL